MGILVGTVGTANLRADVSRGRNIQDILFMYRSDFFEARISAELSV